MVNLPRRPDRIECDVPDTDATFYLKPLSDPQAIATQRAIRDKLSTNGAGPEIEVRPKGGGWYELVRDGEVMDKVQGREKAEARVEELAVVASVTVRQDDLEMLEEMSDLFGLFDQNLIDAEGVEVAGEPFDASNEEHLRSVPSMWKALAVGELLTDAFMGQETGKD